jgi:hypothetical protein
MPLLEGKVGTQTLANGAQTHVALDKQGGQVVTLSGQPLKQAALEGRLFEATSGFAGSTVVADNIQGMSAGDDPFLMLYNPQESGKVFAVGLVGVSTTSGTPGAGMWTVDQYNGGDARITAAGTGLVRALGGIGSSAAVCFEQETPTGSPASVQGPGIGSFFAGAVDGDVPVNIQKDFKGGLLVRQGCFIALCPPAAGTTHIATGWIQYEEIPA